MNDEWDAVIVEYCDSDDEYSLRRVQYPSDISAKKPKLMTFGGVLTKKSAKLEAEYQFRMLKKA